MNLKLRNRLSEIILKGLQKDNQQDVTLAFLAAYCRMVRASGATRVNLNNFSLPRTLTLSCISDLGIFSLDVQGNELDLELDLLPQFQQEVDYLCDRVAAYNSVLSSASKISGLSKDLDWAIRIGVLLFNAALHFECHEFLEGFWREEEGETKEFLQGIISLATALYHLEQGNRTSAVKLFNDAHRRLQAFGKAHCGLAIEALIHQTRKVQALVEEGGLEALEQLKQMPLPKVEFGTNCHA